MKKSARASKIIAAATDATDALSDQELEAAAGGVMKSDARAVRAERAFLATDADGALADEELDAAAGGIKQLDARASRAERAARAERASRAERATSPADADGIFRSDRAE